MPEKTKAYISSDDNKLYSSPQHDFFGRNAGLPFHHRCEALVCIGEALLQPIYSVSGGFI